MEYLENKEAISAREAQRKDPIAILLLMGELNKENKNEFTAADFVAYYTSQFSHDLKMYYDITMISGGESYPFVAHMARFNNINNDRLKIKWNGNTHFFMFSVSLFYMSLCTQVIGRLYGWKQMENFMRASGWPMLHCGLGGLMHPIQVICESELFPPSDISQYIKVMDKAGEYLTKDFIDFFNGKSSNLNKESYNNLCEIVDINDIAAELNARTEEYKHWIADPTTTYESIYVARPEK